MADDFNPYHTWLGIPLAEQPPNHYRLLGLGLFESDARVIEYAADRQMAFVRTLQAGANQAASQKLLNELAAAKICLLNAVRRVEYDAQLRSSLSRAPAPEPSPSLPRATVTAVPVDSALNFDDILSGPSSPRRKQKSNSISAKLLGIAVTICLLGGIAAAGWYFFPARDSRKGPVDQTQVAKTVDDPPTSVSLKRRTAQVVAASTKPPARKPPVVGKRASSKQNLLALIKPDKDTFCGNWTLEGGTLVSEGFPQQWRTIEIPYRPATNYQLTLKASVEPPDNAGIVMGLMAADLQFTAGMNPSERELSGFTMVRSPKRPLSLFNLQKIGADIERLTERDLTLVYVVQDDQTWFTCNGRVVALVPERLGQCRMDLHSPIPAPDRLFLSCKGSRVTVQQLEIQPLKKPLPLPAQENKPAAAAKFN